MVLKRSTFLAAVQHRLNVKRKQFLNYSFLCSSGFLIMFIPKCSFMPFFRDKLDEGVGRVFHQVVVKDALSIEEEIEKIGSDTFFFYFR